MYGDVSYKIRRVLWDRDVLKTQGVIKWSYAANRWMACPFGVCLPNGATFGKSIYDIDSALMKVLFWLSGGREATKRDICEVCFDFTFTRDGKALRKSEPCSYQVQTYYEVSLRGWRSPWFAGLIQAGFVTVRRTKKGYLYKITELGQALVYAHLSATNANGNY